MDEDFKDHLIQLIEILLSPNNLILKKLNKHTFDGIGFLDYITNLFSIFQSNKLPKAQTIYESTVERQLTNLVNLCLVDYEKAVKQDLHTVTDLATIDILHQKCKAEVMINFNEIKKMGSEKNHFEFKIILENKINKNYEFWKSQKDDFFKEMAEINKCQEDFEVEKLATLELEKQLAHMRLELNRLETEHDLKFTKHSKDIEIEKYRRITTIRQRELTEALIIQRQRTQIELDKIKSAAIAEKNKLEQHRQRHFIQKY